MSFTDRFIYNIQLFFSNDVKDICLSVKLISHGKILAFSFK